MAFSSNSSNYNIKVETPVAIPNSSPAFNSNSSSISTNEYDKMKLVHYKLEFERLKLQLQVLKDIGAEESELKEAMTELKDFLKIPVESWRPTTGGITIEELR
jgi:hypothetical protein